MKQKFLKIISFSLSLLLVVDIFLYCSMTAYAFPKRLKDGTWIDIPWTEAGEEIWQTILYGMHQIGAFFVNGADFRRWLENNATYQDLFDENGRLAKYTSVDTETGTVTYNKEIMTVFKSAAEEYAKEENTKEENTKEENGGFYLLPTTDISTVPADWFINAQQFRTFRNIVIEKGVLPVMTRYGSNYLAEAVKNSVSMGKNLC